ncbi:FGFR1 oncogene partner-like [Agrilus planipennis]|uniref:FGFR1 oncogene partner-like n=1 Tax=Agrilus planipennis TaxID=224129 RepID=A0A1W4WJP8_AGRPL|nr:FGFR1 oncogene partner-like [Agrilus planipennis]
MSLDDDVEFRDLLSQTLEVNGCLAKIRAQLRASIFLTLDEDEELQRKEPLANHKVKSYLGTSEGQIMFCLVREFLEFFNLDFTLSVYNVETYADKCYNYGGRRDIIEKLNVLTDDSSHPLLWQLVNTINSANTHSKLPIKGDLNCLSDVSEVNSKSHQPNNSSSSITDLSPTTNNLGTNSSLNTTYSVNSPSISTVNNSSSSSHVVETQKTPDIMPTLNKISSNDTIKSDYSIYTECSNQQTVTDKSNSSPESNEERPESSKSENSRSKCNSNSLIDLHPLQINKTKCSESPLLPSMYNIGKDKVNSKEVDKLLSFDDSTLDESVSVSLVNSSENKSVEGRDATSIDTKEEIKTLSCVSKSSQSDESKDLNEDSLPREND